MKRDLERPCRDLSSRAHELQYLSGQLKEIQRVLGMRICGSKPVLSTTGTYSVGTSVTAMHDLGLGVQTLSLNAPTVPRLLVFVTGHLCLLVKVVISQPHVLFDDSGSCRSNRVC